MNLIWGIILVSVSLKVWIGQIIIAFSPKLAEKINILEPVSDVDKTFFLDIRSTAVWNAISLWTLPLAGILLILNNILWTYLGLIGGSMYLYFVGRTIVSQKISQYNRIRIGRSNKLKVKLLILILWGLVSIVTIILALMELSS